MEIESAKLNPADPCRYETPSKARLEDVIIIALAFFIYSKRSKDINAVRARLRIKFVTEL
jgi:hypothetical protein